ncbi:type II secretion system F family protein [Flavobacteriales bacterium]|nr:type II secretion system F family protein [Flavobacteriales bacterium]
MKKPENNQLAWYQKEIRFSSNNMNATKKEVFYSELFTLMDAGLSIYSALILLVKQSPKENNLCSDLSDQLLNGSTLSQAMQNSNQFTAYEYFTVQIGEDSGNLKIVLSDLALYFKEMVSQRRALISTLSYPIILIFTAFLTVFFMLKFLVPMFEDVFKRFDGELPGVTQWVISFSHNIVWVFYLFILFFLGAYIFYRYFKNKDWFLSGYSHFVLRIPLVGELIRKTHLSRMCHSMSLLLSANLSLEKTLSLVEKMSTFYLIKKSLREVKDNLIQGSSLSHSFSKFSLYDIKMISLIEVAERSNQLSFIFKRLNQQYQSELSHQSKILGTILEPLVILFLGLVVALILVAMYLPMFNLSSSFL